MSEDLADLLNNPEPIRDGDARFDALLSDLQCNILSGHGRKEARYFFLRFADPVKAKYLCGMLPRSPLERALVFTAADSGVLDKLPEATRRALIGVGRSKGDPWLFPKEVYERIERLVITPEKAVREVNLNRKGRVTADPYDFAVNFFLTHRGYVKLTNDPPPADAAFRAGMKGRNGLNDPESAVEQWEENLTDIDALLIVAYDPCSEEKAKTDQLAALNALEQGLREHGGLVGKPLVGRLLTTKLGALAPQLEVSDEVKRKDVAIEAFGFRDGVSQPVFYEADLEKMERRGVLRAPPPKIEDPNGDEAKEAKERARRAAYAPLSLVLRPDPNGRTRHACGSYFVFRKLGQDVEKFYAQVERLQALTGRDEEEVLADLVGRYRDGTPTAAAPGAGTDTFDYRDDSDGRRCPFHAHVRKVNPRADDPHSRKQRIVRHGMPYGPAIERDESGKPKLKDGKITRQGGGTIEKNEIGLLFLCAQASIEEQFERIQIEWANNPNLAWGKLPGADPIIGRLPDGKKNRIRVRRKDERLSKREFEYEPVVSLCGGDYFFAPSISFLRSLLDELWK